MAYRVELTLRAERDLHDLFDRIAADDSGAAARWYFRLEDAIRTLKSFPRRCPVAPESKLSKSELRHLLYGSKRVPRNLRYRRSAQTYSYPDGQAYGDG
jgi:toxin ParE1/3/4